MRNYGICKMKKKNYKIFLALILFFAFTGCVQTVNLGLIKADRAQEFYVDNYKLSIKIIQKSEYEYFYSISFFDENYNTPIAEVKSKVDIKKYPQNSKTHYKHRHKKQKQVSGLMPTFDKESNDYDFKYKFKSKGKYELTISLSEIAGKQLDKDLLISFDHEV